IPAATGSSRIATDVGSFGQSQLEAFRTQGTIADSVPISALLLSGFWHDAEGRYALPSNLPTWWPAVVLLGALIVTGIVQVVRGRDGLGIALLVLGVTAWWLAMGVAWGPSAGTTRWLIDHVPFYQGYREPQKWLMLLALAYAYCVAVGTAWLAERLGQKSQEYKGYVVVLAALLPLVLVPILPWGAGGQLKAVDYPSDWYTVRQRLEASGDTGPVVVLPWHMYLKLDFVGKVVANPAKHFFGPNMVTGNDPELKGVDRVDATALERVINEELLPDGPEGRNAGQILQKYGVRHIILYKEADWRDYEWLDRQRDLRRTFDGRHIRLYELRQER
ncbi:MAG TPA: hypothetical protein VK983_04870, partial [Candidatus Limnocylindrales bacterium]|nr:hypothetical protein [Candidatus Limnocylindrales bacterium]